MDSNIDNINMLSARASQTKASGGERQSENNDPSRPSHHLHEVLLSTPEEYESRRGGSKESPRVDEDEENSGDFQRMAGLRVAAQNSFKLNMREILG